MNSELRQDLVSGDWIVVAPKRALRPDQFKKQEKRKKVSPKNCPFEKPSEKEIIFSYPKSSKKNWEIVSIPNKFPTFILKKDCAKRLTSGPYHIMEARGHQEIVVTKYHDKNFSHLTKNEAYSVLKTFQDRYKILAKDKCLSYISIFQNWGPQAGASVYHPHYQIFGIPVIPPDVEHSLDGSSNYFKENRKCVHCVMIDWERKKRERVINENRGAIAFAPFISRQPFEVRIFPKKHSAYFEDATDSDLRYIADAIQKSLLSMERKLNDPDYNFFLHTAPTLNKNYYGHYHWHIEILPKMTIWAGFELGTGIDITVVDPAVAARILRR